ncbi:hypothetical protein BDV06DRAFT_226495 [Aspergillus oleicola]
MSTKTQITELLFPIFKKDPETQATLAKDGPKLFSHLIGLPGIQFLAWGLVLYDDGERLESHHRGVVLLEWDDPSSLYSFYPSSPKFADFIKGVRPLVPEPDTPELFATVTSAAVTGSAGITQIIKVNERPSTEAVWNRLKNALSRKEMAPVLSHSRGIEDQEGIFLGLIGWGSVEKYEESKIDEVVVGLLEDLGAAGKVLNVIVQLQTMAV